MKICVICGQQEFYRRQIFLNFFGLVAKTPAAGRKKIMSTDKKYTWHKIADSLAEINFTSNGLTEMEVGGKKICLSLQQDKIHACAHKCPHAGGSLADGYMDALGNIVCPLHRYKFSLQTGRNTSGEGYYLKTFPVEVRAEGIFVGFAENNLFGWLK